MGSHVPPNSLGSFTVAEPSHLPPYMHSQGHMVEGQPFGNPHQIASVPQQHVPQQQVPHQFQQDMGQHHMGQHHMGQQHMGQQHMGQQHMGQQQNSMPFGPSDYMQMGFHQSAQHHVPAGVHGGMEHQGNHAPFGVMPQHDPHGTMQQAVTVPQAGFGFEHPPMQHVPQQGFPSDGGFHQQQQHQQPHQPPPAGGGFPPPASGGFNHW